MNRGDIYLESLNLTQGQEQRCSWPVVIISLTAFNLATKLPIVLPITHAGNFARRLGFAVPIPGVQTTGIVRL
ncbi:type II toxin-antitoxin system PemK/MazF family toxin [Aquidulcibacter paucihalophilus]|uniref:type II toxin-antitoxin system PemK/MazF family toxin n=1 Tax=Aquidulcibacter paucihalophilus TaxID=1978549 RepID=UPI001E605270|nr:type II toxin-antitoxin system PemK/MazF family toxin [Aquidulcibacter paucihalophilus]